MDFSLKIIKVENGFIAEWLEEVEDGDWIDKSMVFEEIDSDGLDSARGLLLFILERFGIYGSKHDKRRLSVEIVDQGKES